MHLLLLTNSCAMLNHDEKPERSDLTEEDLERLLEMTNSPYHKHIQNLESCVVGRTVVSSTVGISGFLLYLDDNSWVLSFVDEEKLNWRVGFNEPCDDDLKLLNVKNYGNGRNPFAVDLPYANEICDIGAEVSEAHGKPIVGLAIGEHNFNFCFPEKRELDVMLLLNEAGCIALRVFWEQW